MLAELDRIQRDADSGQYEVWDNLRQRALALLTSPQGVAALDLSRESAATRAAYGQTSFGQSCLLGRRLVEAGVPYVQVNWSRYVEVYYTFSDYGWDTHADNFGLLAEWHGPLFDRVFSTLVDDLEAARAAGDDAGGLHGRIWPDAADQRDRLARPLASSVISRSGPAVACSPAGRSARATPGANIPSAIRSPRPWSGRPCWNWPASAPPPAPSCACSRKDESSMSCSERCRHRRYRSIACSRSSSCSRPPASRQRGRAGPALTTDGTLKLAPVFINNGDEVVFATHEVPNLVSIVRLKLSDGSRRRLHPTVVNHQFDPAFSRDGRFHAYGRSSTSPQMVLVIQDTQEKKDSSFSHANRARPHGIPRSRPTARASSSASPTSAVTRSRP